MGNINKQEEMFGDDSNCKTEGLSRKNWMQ